MGWGGGGGTRRVQTVWKLLVGVARVDLTHLLGMAEMTTGNV